MFTLRCTRKLLDRLGLPPDAESHAAPGNALGDWYANLVRFGREQLVVVVNERTSLTLVLRAKGVRHGLAPEILRTLGWLLGELEVPQDVVEREIAAMQPMAYARTASRSMVATMNERARLAEHLWFGGAAPVDIMLRVAGFPITSGAAEADLFPRRAARRLLGLDPLPPPPATIVRLHVRLADLTPAIWRRLVAPEAVTLPELHRALQRVMGWEDRHLHEFEIGGTRYGMPDEDGLDEALRDEQGVRLCDALQAAGVERFTYRYDYGDDWAHDVVVEAIEPNAQGVRGVVCLDGANRCPPEDVGGTGGYLEFLQALRDPSHADHRRMVAWAGLPFDPAGFDLELVNALLRSEFGG